MSSFLFWFQNTFAHIEQCRLGIIEPKIDDERRMVGWQATAASRYLSTVFEALQERVV